MNRTRKHIKAAKARKDWQDLQDQKPQEDEKGNKKSILRKVEDTENSLREIA